MSGTTVNREISCSYSSSLRDFEAQFLMLFPFLFCAIMFEHHVGLIEQD